MYSEIGSYTVTLTVTSDAGSNMTRKEVMCQLVLVFSHILSFLGRSNIWKCALTVKFYNDDGEGPSGIGPIWLEWHFSDGTKVDYQVDDNESAIPYAIHTYEHQEHTL